MLKRIALTTVLVIGAPITVYAKISLENIRQPEAAVEESIEAGREQGVESKVPSVEHCLPHKAQATTSAQPFCPESEGRAARSSSGHHQGNLPTQAR
ncbi:MAG: hypothetical protein ABW154_07695 [Dyella sp.]